MQGLEDELVAITLKEMATPTTISKGDKALFAIYNDARIRSYLINCETRLEDLTNSIKRLVDNPNADTLYPFMHLADLYHSLEQSHVDFADRKLSKYIALLRKWRVAVARGDNEVARQCYDGMNLLKKCKTDPRMQTLNDRIKQCDTLNLPPAKETTAFTLLVRRATELRKLIGVLKN